jgi:hypothetical protein
MKKVSMNKASGLSAIFEDQRHNSSKKLWALASNLDGQVFNALWVFDALWEIKGLESPH